MADTDVASAIIEFITMTQAAKDTPPSEATVKSNRDALLAACKDSPATARKVFKNLLTNEKGDDRIFVLGTLNNAASELTSEDLNFTLRLLIVDQKENLKIRSLAMIAYKKLNKSKPTIDLCINLINAKSITADDKSFKWLPIQLLANLGKDGAAAIPTLKAFTPIDRGDPTGTYALVAIDCIETGQPIAPFLSWTEVLAKTKANGISDKEWGIAANKKTLATIAANETNQRPAQPEAPPAKRALTYADLSAEDLVAYINDHLIANQGTATTVWSAIIEGPYQFAGTKALGKKQIQNIIENLKDKNGECAKALQVLADKLK